MSLYLKYKKPSCKESNRLSRLEHLIARDTDRNWINVEYGDDTRSIGEIDLMSYLHPNLWIYELKSTNIEKNREKAFEQLERHLCYVPKHLKSIGFNIRIISLVFVYGKSEFKFEIYKIKNDTKGTELYQNKERQCRAYL